jgi:hypothetical protein
MEYHVEEESVKRLLLEEFIMKKSGLFVGMFSVVLAFALSGCTTVDRVSRHYEEGGVYQDISVPNKDFQSLGLVFAEYTRETDGHGGEKGDVYLFYNLLKEAQKLGADNIVNVKIEGNYQDRNERYLFGLFTKDYPTRKTWYGSATAIKYTETLRNTQTQVVVSGTGTAVIGTAPGTTTEKITTETVPLAGQIEQDSKSGGLFASTPSENKKSIFSLFKK